MAKRVNTLLLFLVLLSSLPFAVVNADCKKMIGDFDQKFYPPQNMSMKDLVFVVRLDKLTKLLNEEKIFGNLKDVYFKVMWMVPETFRIEVAGLPAGFEDRKEQLRQLVRNRMDFVLPHKLAPRLRSYSEQRQKNLKNGDVVCKVEDQTHTRLQDNIELTFGRDGRLKKFAVSSPTGTSVASSQMKEKEWSKNRWVLDNLSVETTNVHGVVTVIDHDISYKVVGGFGLPVRVETKTSYKFEDNKKMPVITSAILFSEYQVNTGKAKETITKDIQEIKKQNNNNKK
jgi:hypothetical protein